MEPWIEGLVESQLRYGGHETEVMENLDTILKAFVAQGDYEEECNTLETIYHELNNRVQYMIDDHNEEIRELENIIDEQSYEINDLKD